MKMVLLHMVAVQDMRDIVLNFLDSPNTTSAITYGIKWQVHSGTTYLNRTWDANWFHGISTITAMEVAA